MIINAVAELSASSTGDTIIATAENGSFTNNEGNSAFSTPSGRWLVYSDNPTNTTEGLSSHNKQYTLMAILYLHSAVGTMCSTATNQQLQLQQIINLELTVMLILVLHMDQQDLLMVIIQEPLLVIHLH